MNDEGTLGLQNWGRYYRPLPLKGDPGLQLMPLTMPFLSDGHDSANPRRECGISDTFFPKRCFFPQKGIPELHSMPVDYARDLWYHNNNENGKILPFYGSLLPEATVDSAGFNTHMLRMLQPVDLPKDVKTEVADNSDIPPQVIVPLKKRSKGHGEGRPIKGSKTKKVIVAMEKPCNSSGRRRAANKNLDVVINGVDLDLSEIPAPLCTCTGRPQQCYRWGAGGWQSACCTTSVSMYPLPMNTKRRGARIAGRKMSLGAFKKVLEKLAMEGQDISSPIDLKPFWAKHGTNKFVTIR